MLSTLFSQNWTEIDSYLEFTREQRQTPAVFAINPQLPRTLLQTLQLSLARMAPIAMAACSSHSHRIS
jgi:hypothetical protein